MKLLQILFISIAPLLTTGVFAVWQFVPDYEHHSNKVPQSILSKIAKSRHGKDYWAMGDDVPSAYNSCIGDNDVAMTYDDGPSIEYTEPLLDLLAQYNAKATFFVLGRTVSESGEAQRILRRMIDEGHTVANHSWDHTSFATLSEDGIRDQIRRTNDAIYRAIGIKPKYLRLPYGEVGPGVERIAQEEDMLLVFWNADSNDWKHKYEDDLSQGSYAELKALIHRQGLIVLQHGIFEYTLRGQDAILRMYEKAGKRFVSMKDCLYGSGHDDTSEVSEHRHHRHPHHEHATSSSESQEQYWTPEAQHQQSEIEIIESHRHDGKPSVVQEIEVKPHDCKSQKPSKPVTSGKPTQKPQSSTQKPVGTTQRPVHREAKKETKHRQTSYKPSHKPVHYDIDEIEDVYSLVHHVPSDLSSSSSSSSSDTSSSGWSESDNGGEFDDIEDVFSIKYDSSDDDSSSSSSFKSKPNSSSRRWRHLRGYGSKF